MSLNRVDHYIVCVGLEIMPQNLQKNGRVDKQKTIETLINEEALPLANTCTRSSATEPKLRAKNIILRIGKNMSARSVTLREITSTNINTVLDLSVSQEQKNIYPRSNGYSIAEGLFLRDDDLVWMRVIYADEIPVGFLMTSEAPDRGEYFLWRLMVDVKHQRKGYGSRALQLLIKRLKTSPNAKKLVTSHLKGDGDAGPFYLKLGFKYTGTIEHSVDHVMELDLCPHALGK